MTQYTGCPPQGKIRGNSECCETQIPSGEKSGNFGKKVKSGKNPGILPHKISKTVKRVCSHQICLST